MLLRNRCGYLLRQRVEMPARVFAVAARLFYTSSQELPDTRRALQRDHRPVQTRPPAALVRQYVIVCVRGAVLSNLPVDTQ